MSTLKKAMGVLLIGGSLSFMPVAHAEIVTYEGIGEYIMSDFETPDIAKQRAKVRAEQNAAEQAGVYVSSYTKTVNHLITVDEVTAIANTIIKVIDEKYTIVPNGNNGGGFHIKAVIKANVDSSSIDVWLNREREKNIELIEQNKRLQYDRDVQNREIEKLREKIVLSKNENDKRILETALISEDKKFLSSQKVEEGIKLYSEGDYIKTIEVCSQAIGINERNADAYSCRGRAYLELKNNPKAMSDFIKAIEIDPKIASAYNGRGVVYCNQKEYSEALINFKKALEIDPMLAIAYNNIGYIYDVQGNYQQAILNYSKAIEIDKNLPLAYNNRGGVYSALGNYQKALDDYAKAIKINPNYYEAYYNRGISYVDLGEYKLAIADYNRAIAINPRDADLYCNRGVAYERLKDWQQAIVNYSMAIEINHQFGLAYYNRGLAYNKIGKIEEANKDFDRARSLGYVR